MDRDGYTDIVAGGWWYKNPRDIGLTWQRMTIGAPLNKMFLLHDLDGDGDTDILGTQGVGDADNDSFAWGQNNGSGVFTVRTNIQQGDGMFPQGAICRALSGRRSARSGPRLGRRGHRCPYDQRPCPAGLRELDMATDLDGDAGRRDRQR